MKTWEELVNTAKELANAAGRKATDIADLVVFLTGDKARFITGQTYVIDGGRSLSMKGSD